MDIVLWVMVGLITIMAWSTWSIGRSYFEKGRLRGIEEATRELRLGMDSHLDNQSLPDDVRTAVSALQLVLDTPSSKRVFGADPVHAQLWTLGSVLADACWMRGHGAGVRRKAAAEGRIRMDLSPAELLQLGGLANYGFQHMMPNLRIVDVLRFANFEDAIEASRALSKLESGIPRQSRADLLCYAEGREHLIEDWWKPAPSRAIA